MNYNEINALLPGELEKRQKIQFFHRQDEFLKCDLYALFLVNNADILGMSTFLLYLHDVTVSLNSSSYSWYTYEREQSKSDRYL